ncbi:TPA: signal peptide peptidase SppA [Methanocaldococcus jannaschii]|uniref:Putative protease MJ0651 n=2 Tax=Methanocaldococcus jannaschii TaxID=2190 RepID=Y651_METJA|nr:signal peptide peptidase SppA [Methanocaldococcus jannaschii]Q58067.2 RecName: Full=Putative protease MJ0651 [Methanocaldococcus jannaschii DSM 2661]AAB98642.1 protease IV (sppA) [Methanocaldococcus jannaschii DSM 2661]HII59605.1 signal peptide peptidase SppA [Methanocaldococcus jannaschii]
MKKIYIILLILFVILISLIGASILLVMSLSGENVDLFGGEKIAKVYLCNEIYFDYNQGDGIFPQQKKDARYYINLLDDLEKDDSVKGVLLVVNSPGGEVIASEKLARKVEELAKKKPVVVYVEGLDASGAYMVSAPADYIVAEKHSIVGSIGVRMDLMHYYGLMKKLGINVTTIKAGKYKDIGSPFRPMTKEEKEYLQKMINETYMDFVKWVAEHRHLSINYTLKIADGKIYSGEDAKKVGLVDEVGTEEDALKKLEQLANVSNPEIVEYGLEENKGLFGLTYYLGYGIGKGIGEVLYGMEKINGRVELLS